jgi:predicted RNase H-like HicB family nuclease
VRRFSSIKRKRMLRIFRSNPLKIAHVTYTFEDQIWVAECDEVGMVGYQGKSLEKVKKLVNEGLQVFFEDHPFKVIESIAAESEFNLN